MARPYWSGQVQISLVTFGVKLFVATEASSEIRFHQIDRGSGERVKHQKVLASAVESDPEEGAAPVEKSQIVKGYEYSKGRYVTIEPAELAHLRVPSKHTMEVTQFVDEDELSPEYFEKPYFVVPENDAQTEAFLTVRKALIDTKKVALSKVAFAGREHVVAIAPAGKGDSGGMMAYTMRYAAELRDPASYFADVKKMEINDDSLALAKELIKRKAVAFDASKFVDGYEVAVKELVEAKLQHVAVPRDEAPVKERGKVINLMDALRRSVSGGTEAKDAAPVTMAEKKKDVKSAKVETPKGPTLVKSEAHAGGKHETKSARVSRRKSA
ncbi:MAG: Ku protein [Acidobacteria bacterium]|nr:Ku protein [Acidobacteriota bacterium]